MCSPLSAYAQNLCAQYRAGTINQTKLALYKQLHRITQDEYDTILDVECPCGWIEPQAMTVGPDEAA